MGYSFIEQSKRDGSLVGFWSLMRWNQNFQDLSGQGNHITVTSNVWWGGGGIQFARNNGYMSIPDAAELQLSAFTLFVLGWFNGLERAAANPGFLITRMDSAGMIEWQFGIDDTPQLIFVDTNAASTVTRAVEYRGMRSLGITVVDGGTPIGYGNGLGLGNFSGAIDIDAYPDYLIYLGNRDAFDRSLYAPMQAALIFNDVLTASEMSTLHGELMAMPGGEH